MASKKRNSPGLAPLGNSPFGKEKLEGPKMKHDDHGPDASVPAKTGSKIESAQAWEKSYDTCKLSTFADKSNWDAFSPQRSTDRLTVHLKVNKEDH